MVVVVAIITILVALVVPAAATLWNQRKLADAENTIQGLLMNARAKAVAAGTKHGLFFFVDGEGVQQVRLIRQVDVVDLARRDLLGLDPKDTWNYVSATAGYRLTLENVYEIAEGRSGSIPAPIRASPRYIVAPTGPENWDFFSDPEVGNNTFASLSGGTDNAQRHRNYFTLVFGTEGQLLVREPVLIIDQNKVNRAARFEDNPEIGIGDITGLPVGDNSTNPKDPYEPTVDEFYPDQDPGQPPECIDPDRTRCQKVSLLIVDDKNVAINFPSVDGVLVYDDSLFVQFPTDKDKRAYLERTGQPMYVSRHTGTVLRGPVGDVQ
jgi:hypothetical protein